MRRSRNPNPNPNPNPSRAYTAWPSTLSTMSRLNPIMPVGSQKLQLFVRMHYIRNLEIQFAVLFVVLLSCSVYVYQTYRPQHFNSLKMQVATEIPFSSIFFIDYVLNLIGALSISEYVFGTQGLVDALALLPAVGIVIVVTAPAGTAADLAFLRFFRIAKVVRVLRMMRVLRLGAFGYKEDNEVTMQIIKLAIGLASILFIATGVVFEFDNARADAFNYPLESFHVALYYIVVTCTTLGYGDFYPTSTSTRLLIVVIMLVAFTVVPYQVSNLVNTMATRPKYSGALHVDRFTDHIVVCGAKPSASLARFCEELFHENHVSPILNRKLVVVVLSRFPPNKHHKAVMQNPVFLGRLTWLVGSSTSPTDLAKVRAETAKAIFIFQTQGCKDRLEVEDEIFIKTISTLRYITRKLEDCVHDDGSTTVAQTGPIIVVETISAKSRDTLHRSGADLVMCYEEFKYAVLAHGALFPGFVSLFLNLVKSDPYNLDDIPTDTWQHDYASGSEYELYSVTGLANILQESVKSSTFIEAAAALYHFSNGSVVLLAIEKDGQVIINPGTAVKMDECDNAFMFALTIHDAITATSNFEVRRSDTHRGLHDTWLSIESLLEEKEPCPINETWPNGINITFSKSEMNLLTVRSKSAARLKTQRSSSYPDLRRVFSELSSSPKSDTPRSSSQPLPISSLENHMVLCICNPEAHQLHAIISFLKPVRSRSNDAVVILHEKAGELEEQLAKHQFRWENVYFQTGCPKDSHYLRTCGVARARAVVVMGQRNEQFESYKEHGSTLPDRHTVICTLKLQDVLDEHSQGRDTPPEDNHQTFTITELVLDSSVYYLKQHANDVIKTSMKSGTKRNGVRVRLRYSDSLDCMIYDWPMFAQGRLLTQSIFDAFLVQCMYNKSTLAFWEALLHTGRGGYARRSSGSFSAKSSQCGRLDKIELPSEFAGKRYGTLVKHLMVRDNRVPIALYRCERAKHQDSGVLNDIRELYEGVHPDAPEFAATIAYTHVNPHPDTILSPKDEIFLI